MFQTFAEEVKEEVGSRSLWVALSEGAKETPSSRAPLPHYSGSPAERRQSQQANECTLSTNWHLPLPSTSTRIKSCVARAAEFQQQPERRLVSQVGTSGKQFVNSEDLRDLGSISGLGRSPGGGHDNPLQYSCLENLMDRGA